MRRLITGYPKAARIRGLDKNHPGDWLMGIVLRPSGDGFLCEAPIGTFDMLRDVRPAKDIELLDMPLTED